MTLYHGSNVTVEAPKLIVPFRALDLGVGFMGEIDRTETLARLKIRKLYNQLVFATAKSLQFIRFVRAEDVP